MQRLNLNPNLHINRSKDIKKQIFQFFELSSVADKGRTFFKNNEMILKKSFDFIIESIDSEINGNNDYYILAALSSINSAYGRFGTIDNQPQNLINKEWFAEGFAYLFLAEKEQRTKIWEIWFDLFVEKLQTWEYEFR